MNAKHLGDALDHWKGSMFDLLQSRLRNLHVLPMFTDIHVWSEPDLQVFARLLRVPRERILRADTPLTQTTRRSYFQNLPVENQDDIFVDPDTGLAGKHQRGVQHLRINELADILPIGSDRIVLVYQHASRQDDYVGRRQAALMSSTECGGCHCFAYKAGNVAMFAVSRDHGRLSALREEILGVMNGHARVTPIQSAPPSAR